MPDYRHTVGGEAYDRPFEAGDKVAKDVPASKLREWLAAGVIEKTTKTSEEKADDGASA